jgi:hypothetical protein
MLRGIQGWLASGLACVLTTSACGGGQGLRIQGTPDGTGGKSPDQTCKRFAVRVEGPYHQALADPLDHPLLDQVPAEARRTARAAGLEPLILALLQHADQVAPPSTERLAISQQLFVRIVSMETQLESLLSEIDCTDDVIEGLSGAFSAQEDAREGKLALASIVVGAVAAAGAGFWQLAHDDAKGAAVVGIVGGVGSAGLGMAALVPKRHTMVYSHAHNQLAPIAYDNNESRTYPTFVWRLLNAPSGAAGSNTPRLELSAWFEARIAASYPESERARVRALLYGPGGTYDQDLMDLRESMFDALETKLNGFGNDLELLSRYLVKLTEPVSIVP